MKSKIIAKTLATVLIFCIIGTINIQVFGVTQSDKDNLQNQINQAKSEKQTITNNKNQAQNDLNSINDQISSAEDALESLKSQLEDVNDQISNKEQDISKEQDAIKEKNDLLKQRLVALYEAGDTSYLDVLLNSDNLVDFLSGCSVIQTITQTDSDLINDLQGKEQQLENDKKDLETNKQKVEDLKGQQEIKNATLATLQDQKKQQVSKLSSDEQAKQGQIDQYNVAMQKVDDELAAKWKAAQEAIAKAAASQAKSSKSSSSSSSSGGTSGTAGSSFNGTFIWPCESKTVISCMKKRWGKWHKGIDINAHYEPILAAADGIAFNATNPGGYGTYIMIVHGNSGYVSLYGHLSSSNVSDGESVHQGQKIGTSGASGDAQGPHLHFEIRKASSPGDFFGNNWLNPLDYLPGGYTIAPGAAAES